MSVVIKGFNKPKDCYSCRFNANNTWCSITSGVIDRDDYTCDVLCPITQLPKGHGELKDFEKIYADMSEREELARQRVIDTPSSSPCYMRYMSQLNERTAFKEMLFDAPTIIEADKAESEDK